MKKICLIVFICFFMMSFSVYAFEDVSRTDYRTRIKDLLIEYGKDFDECFPELPEDFPSLPANFSDLDVIIDELEVGKWYHRKIPYYSTQIDEIFFTFKTELSYFAIRVAYLYNEEEDTFIIYDVHFYETIEGIDSEVWHMETLPYGVTDESIEKIDVCKGTPDFVLISLIFATIIAVFGQKLYRKKFKN